MPATRRDFLCASLALPAFAAKPTAPRPNVLLLLADNLPAWVLSCYGNTEIRTPGLDRLAQTGTRFLNHCVCTPDPAPSRATILTGRTPMQLGNANAPAAGDVTLDQLMGGAGYACETTGGTDAQKIIDGSSAAKPFFLTVNFKGLEPPYGDIPQSYLDRFAKSSFAGFSQDPTAANARSGKEMLANRAAAVRKYAAALAMIDDQVQAIVARIAQRRLVDQTLIVFTSSSGALLGRHGLWDAGQASEPANMFEEAIDTPLFWSWPGRIPPQAVRPELISTYDLLPTFCDLLGLELPARNLCGRSYALLVAGKPLPKKQPWRNTIFGHAGNTDMAHVERYKLVLRDEGKGPGELYDLRTDPVERNNQYADPQFLTVRNSLTADLRAWKQKYAR